MIAGGTIQGRTAFTLIVLPQGSADVRDRILFRQLDRLPAYQSLAFLQIERQVTRRHMGPGIPTDLRRTAGVSA